MRIRILDGKIRYRDKHLGSETLKFNCHENSKKCTIHILTAVHKCIVLYYKYCTEYST